MPEFTGERVIPNQVDPDLWNEHISRYLFATRLSAHRRVLDIACGTGYGAAELARNAASVNGIDISEEAIAYAREHFVRPNLTFEAAPAQSIPLPDASFDLITAFEVIEHLDDWQALLAEAKRLLAPGGQFLVSTPNKSYYADSRKLAGPNPFHAHEFEFDEFHQALESFFPHVTFWLQNHTSTVVLQPLGPSTASHLRMEESEPDPASAHFYLAVCATSPMLGAPSFVYVPSAGNVLRERELHISRLEAELAEKDAWLAQARATHKELVDTHTGTVAELEARNRWAADLDSQLAATNARVSQLQDELASEQAFGRATAEAYEISLANAHRDLEERTQWARDTETRLTAELENVAKHLAESNRLLQQAELTVEERTRWALDLQKQLEAVQVQLNGYIASRWTKLGRSLGLGPKT